MNITQIQENVEKVIKELDKARFVFDLLQAYGFPNTLPENGL